MEHRNDRDQTKTPTHRQSLLLTTGRRATVLFRTLDHSQPPVADPANPPELNLQRRHDYENIRKLNEALETVIDNFSMTHDNIQRFSQTVDQTEQLLDMWASILSQSEHTRRLLENERWQGTGTPPLLPSGQQQPNSQQQQQQQQQQQARQRTGAHEPSTRSRARRSITTRIPVKRASRKS